MTSILSFSPSLEKWRWQELSNFSASLCNHRSLHAGPHLPVSAALAGCHLPFRKPLSWHLCLCHRALWCTAGGSHHSLALCCFLSHLIVSDSLRLHQLSPTRLLRPWNSPGKDTGVGFHALLQGIFPTQGSNLGLLCLLYCRRILYH